MRYTPLFRPISNVCRWGRDALCLNKRVPSQHNESVPSHHRVSGPDAARRDGTDGTMTHEFRLVFRERPDFETYFSFRRLFLNIKKLCIFFSPIHHKRFARASGQPKIKSTTILCNKHQQSCRLIVDRKKMARASGLPKFIFELVP